MKLLGMVWMAVLIPALSAQIPDVHSLMATARQRMEATDFRASGHLVWVQANGTRISHPITIEARWFPGVLRVKAETSGESKSFTATGAASATHVLIELRPDGKNAIWIAHPGDKSTESGEHHEEKLQVANVPDPAARRAGTRRASRAGGIRHARISSGA